MSGVCGVVDFSGAPVDPEVLRRMTAASPHRGPDGTSYWSDGPAAFAHQALHATPEAVRETQPLVGAGRGVCVAADARIDNRPELIPDLRSSGHLEIANPTDSELILAGWSRWGTGAPFQLIGDFAFAVWDREARSLILVRDALGIRPLHYAVLPHGIAFASDAQQVLAHPEVSSDIDERSVAELLVGIRRESERTMFRRIRRLPPGHMLVANSTDAVPKRYWDPPDGPRIRHRRSADYSAHYLEILRRAVRDRLRTQGTVVGVYMSGGLDSTAVAAVAKSELDGMTGAPRLVAQSFSFDEFASCDERDHSEAVAEHCGFEIEYCPADGQELLSAHPPIEAPAIGWEAAGRAARERLARRGARVVLTGHLRDFGVFGHDRVGNLDRLLRGQGRLIRELRDHGRREGQSLFRVLVYHLLKPLLSEGVLRRLRRLRGRETPPRLPSWLPTEIDELYGLGDLLRTRSGLSRLLHRRSPEARRRLLFLDDIGWVVNWHDRAEAQAGLEARHPLLDRRLVEFFARIPTEEIWRPGPSKPLVRRAMAGLLPESVRLRRDKTTFGEYICKSIRIHSGDLVQGLLESPLLGRMGLVNTSELRDAWSRCEADPSGILSLWFPIATEMWLREFSRRVR